MTRPVLYEYWRSSASYRVRIALNLLGIAYESVPVNLLAKQQKAAEHLARNPQGLVPVLEIDGLLITQSLAIVEYLAEKRPGSGLLPADPAGRARVRTLAYAIAMEIAPLCNTGPANHVVELTGGGEPARIEWMRKFIGEGLAAFEAMQAGEATGLFCHGDRPTMADICLVPQLYNAHRWGIPVDGLPRIAAIGAECGKLPAFQKAYPRDPAELS